MKSIRHLFGDFDGPLYDSYPNVTRAFLLTLEEVGCASPPTPRQALSLLKVSVFHAAEHCARASGLDVSHVMEVFARYHARESRFTPYAGLGECLGALDSAGITADEIDFILCSTVQGPYITPGLACLVQGRIGASCPCLDVNGACAGFVYALDWADAYLKAGKARRILVIAAEELSRLCDWEDRATAVLFGDGAGAVVVESGDGLIASRFTTRANETALWAESQSSNSPFAPPRKSHTKLTMQGQEVYKFAVSSASADIRAVLEQANVKADDVSMFLLHQANMRIVEAVRARMKQPEEKFPTCIQHTGNVSSACIPVLLDEINREGRLKHGDLLMLSAFGAGLVTGACLLRW